MNIATLLVEAACGSGNRPAIVERDRSITFAELDRAAASTAQTLAAAGLSAGTRALVFSPMSIDLYVTIIAILRLGATAVFVDPSRGAADLAACVARIRPHAFVAVPRAHLLRITTRAIRAIPVNVVIRKRVPARKCVPEITPCDGNTPAIITFTSGSTTQPKAAVRTHGFLLSQHAALAEALDARTGDVDLTTLPVFLLSNLAAGVTSIIPDADLTKPGSIDVEAVARQIARERPTRTVASPALLDALAAHAISRGVQFDSFERIFTGGGPVFPKTLDRIADASPRATVTVVYGCTEAEPIALIDRSEISVTDRDAMRNGAGLVVGRPASSIHVRILADGEIAVAGDHVITGYLDGVGDSETKFAEDGRVWHRTGDAGYFDARGRLWLLGRCSGKVDDEQGVIHPFAVECAASEIAGVRHSALARYRGRRVLVVEAERGARELRKQLLDRLAWAKLADVLFVPHIPLDRRHNAKVDMPQLQRLLDAA